VLRWQEWMREAWDLLRQDLGAHYMLNLKAAAAIALPPQLILLVGGGIALLLMGGCGALGAHAAQSDQSGGGPGTATGMVSLLAGSGVAGALMVGSVALAYLVFLVAALLVGLGYTLVLTRRLTAGELDDTLLWRGKALFSWQLLLFMLVYSLINSITEVIPLLPMVVGALLWFSGTLVVLGGRDAISSLQESYTRTRAGWLQMVLLNLVLGLIACAAMLVGSPLIVLGFIPLLGVIPYAAFLLVMNWLGYVSLLAYRDNFPDDGLTAPARHPDLCHLFPTRAFPRAATGPPRP